MTRILPKKGLDIRNKSINDFPVAVVIEKENDTKAYRIGVENTIEFINALKKATSFSESEEEIRKFGEPISMDYFINNIPAIQTSIVGWVRGAYSVYRIGLPNCEKPVETKVNKRIMFKPKTRPLSFGDTIRNTKSRELPEKNDVRLDNYLKVQQLLKEGLGPHNAERIYSDAQDYCNKKCTEPTHLNPMITCAYVCEVWKIKNKVLSYKKGEKIL